MTDTTIEEIEGRIWDRMFAPVPVYLARRDGTKPLMTVEAESRRVLINAARRHGCTVADLRGPSRTARLVNARRNVIFELRAEHQLSTPAIGRLLQRDHTTILYHLGALSRQEPAS